MRLREQPLERGIPVAEGSRLRGDRWPGGPVGLVLGPDGDPLPESAHAGHDGLEVVEPAVGGRSGRLGRVEELDDLLHEPDDDRPLHLVELRGIPQVRTAPTGAEGARHQVSFWKVAHRP
jgi:hypothetical protein